MKNHSSSFTVLRPSAQFADIYDIIIARTAAQRQQAYRLRYQVYCLENDFEDPDNFPDQLEHDDDDSRAEQVIVLHRAHQLALGVARIILPGDEKLPIQQLCRDSQLQNKQLFPVPTSAEISRFCISMTQLKNPHKNR